TALAPVSSASLIFLVNEPSSTQLYSLSLHAALPLSKRIDEGLFSLSFRAVRRTERGVKIAASISRSVVASLTPELAPPITPATRSEEHTSELQSRENLVCRLLLEKKKTKPPRRQTAR